MENCFLSYSHDNDVHCQKVKNLTDKLRYHGIDADFDGYNPHPPEGWFKWMEKKCKSDKIIIVISEQYIADFEQIGKPNSGARSEGAMISSVLHSNGVNYSGMAIVIFENNKNLEIPHILRACTHYFVDREDGFKALLSFLRNQLIILKPQLGDNSNISNISQKYLVQSFTDVCNLLKPLMDENLRIFSSYGPNSENSESEKEVRMDLTLWYKFRDNIVSNNSIIADIIHCNMKIIPILYQESFTKWITHIEAFKAHIEDETIDYRNFTFPIEVTEIIEENR